ncbi:MAG: hypothetical protein JXJ04_10945 [Spirochaetales bacterium]|nr:hypothetical protein [Spirochaetales bacterium]
MRKQYSLILILLIMTLSYASAQGIISVNLGSSYSCEEPELLKPDIGILTGYDYFHSFTNTISLLSTLGGFLNYRYLDNEWRYVYDCTLDISFRSEKILFKPSFKTEGEHFYSTELVMPHRWEYSGKFFFSYDIGTTSLFVSPGLSWEDANFLVTGDVGYIFPVFMINVMTLKFIVGKTLFESEDNELYFSPQILFSWYPPEPYTLDISFAFTWYDSDYVSEVGDSREFMPIFDFIEFLTDIEYSTIVNESFTWTMYVPLSLIMKRHHAVDNGLVLAEDEWIFMAGIQTDIEIDFYSSHRCVISCSGEKAFSNSAYQAAGEFMLSVAYEFLF